MTWQYWLLIALLVPTLAVYTYRRVREHQEHVKRMAEIKAMREELHKEAGE